MDVNSELPIVAEVVRGGTVESVHHGIAAGLGHDGGVVLAVGQPDLPVFARSSLKPVQALAMLRAGLDVDGAQLAIVAGSHSGEDMHLTAVHAVLNHAGLAEDALQCPPDLPLDPSAAAAHLHAGTGPRPALMNCSGKHAGMLATCVAAGWPTENYRDPDHPLQQAIRATLTELAGEPISTVTVDGCGAPLFAVSPVGLARAVRALVVAPPGSRRRRVADSMRAHPELVGGTGRSDTLLMRAVPGLVVKHGAEGMTVAAAPDGRACAVKIADGAGRAVTPVLIAVLGALGVVPTPLPPVPASIPAVPAPGPGAGAGRQEPTSDDAPHEAAPGSDGPRVENAGIAAAEAPGIDASGVGISGIDVEALAHLATPPVLGGGRRVGELRARPLTATVPSPLPG